MNWDLRHRKSSLAIRLLLAAWIAVIVVVLCATGHWWGLLFVVPWSLTCTCSAGYSRPAPPGRAVFAELLDRDAQARSTGALARRELPCAVWTSELPPKAPA